MDKSGLCYHSKGFDVGAVLSSHENALIGWLVGGLVGFDCVVFYSGRLVQEARLCSRNCVCFCIVFAQQEIMRQTGVMFGRRMLSQ